MAINGKYSATKLPKRGNKDGIATKLTFILLHNYWTVVIRRIIALGDDQITCSSNENV